MCGCDLSTCFVEACLYVYCQVAEVGECQYDAYFTLLPTGTTLACPFAFVYASVVLQALSVVEYFHFSFGWVGFLVFVFPFACMFKRVSRTASGQIAWLICVAHSTIIRGRLGHLCPAGCCGEVACADREKSIARAFGLCERVALTMITVPASNKWTSMDRNLRKEALLLSLWGITRRAMQRALKVDETDDPDVSIVVVAAPALQSPGVHKVLESAGAKKAVAFHADSHSEFNTLCWIICCSPAMRLHYKLFKNGRWLSHCPPDRDRLSTF